MQNDNDFPHYTRTDCVEPMRRYWVSGSFHRETFHRKVVGVLFQASAKAMGRDAAIERQDQNDLRYSAPIDQASWSSGPLRNAL